MGSTQISQQQVQVIKNSIKTRALGSILICTHVLDICNALTHKTMNAHLNNFDCWAVRIMDMQQTFVDPDPSAKLMPSQPNTSSRDIDGGEITDLLNFLDKIEHSCRRWRKFRLVTSLICHWKRRRSTHCRPHKKQKT